MNSIHIPSLGNLLLSLFSDSDAVLRGRALEVFVRRSYRACGVSGSSHLAVATQGPGIMGARCRGSRENGGGTWWRVELL